MTAFLFWFLSLTWGLLMTIIGAITSLVIMVIGHKPKRFGYLIYFELGKNWGGINLGPFFFVDNSSTLKTKQHEAGHGIQNIIFGPFMPFVVGLPSLIRCKYRDIIYSVNREKYYSLPDYYSIWFEKQATLLGQKFFRELV